VNDVVRIDDDAVREAVRRQHDVLIGGLAAIRSRVERSLLRHSRT